MRRGIVGAMTAILCGVCLASPAAAGPAPVHAAASAPWTTRMVATAYGPSLKDNYPYGATDYFGAPLKPGDVAVDPRVIPLGSRLYITGYHDPTLPAGGFYAVAVDEGGAIKGHRLDIFINAPRSVVQRFGIQKVTVTVLGP